MEAAAANSHVANAPNQTVFSIGYDFHPGNHDNGNVFAIANYRDGDRSQSFTYDSLNRLTHAENSGTDCTQTLPDGHTEYWGNNYVYDAWGNLYQKNVTKCSAENLQVSVTAQNRLAGYSYDAAGNMTGDGINTAAYDAENRLTQVSSGNATYLYDSEGNRVRKNAGSVSTEYVYFGGNVIAERNPSAGNWTDYIFFNGKRVARVILPASSTTTSPTIWARPPW